MTEAGLATSSEGARHKQGFVAGDIIGIVAGALLVGFFALQMQQAVDLFRGVESTFSVRAIDLWINSALLFVVLGLLPFLWVWTTRRGGWQGMLDYFRLFGAGPALLRGAGLGFLLVLGIIAVGLAMQALGLGGDNEALGPIQSVLSLPLVIAISLSAALGEEILFRGIIQKHIGLWPQAVLFGLLHAYQGVTGIVLTTILALIFGAIVKRGYSLWIPIAAHFMFDFIQLSILLIAEPA